MRTFIMQRWSRFVHWNIDFTIFDFLKKFAVSIWSCPGSQQGQRSAVMQSSSQQRWRQIRVLPCRGPGSPLLSSSGPRWSECFHSQLRSAGEESRAAKHTHACYASCLCVNAAFLSLICAVKLNLTACSYTDKRGEEVNESEVEIMNENGAITFTEQVPEQRHRLSRRVCQLPTLPPVVHPSSFLSSSFLFFTLHWV